MGVHPNALAQRLGLAAGALICSSLKVWAAALADALEAKILITSAPSATAFLTNAGPDPPSDSYR